MSIYLDSSFVVSLYVTDSHSFEARQEVRAGAPFLLTPFHLAEWAHALSQQEFRGNLTAQEARAMNAVFAADRASGLWRLTSFPETAFDVCADLARKHGSGIGMRTLDSLHVACAIELKAERLWTFDERLAKLAKAQGLKTN
ncbi:MAG TPA: type II toxin-antitoxin system VapC family toxin [Candidatus Sulfotelmatobacter sp.]|nr:type II toxin-antitoxin system VapC family toxin [Candidatus Sulfotelmatobacter sp.]